MIENLLANAATPTSILVGGAHGYVWLIMKSALSTILLVTLYNTPTRPGPIIIYDQNNTD